MTPLHDQVLIRLYVHVYLIVQTHISERVQRERERETVRGRERDRCEVRQDAEVCEKMKINLCHIYQYYVVCMASEKRRKLELKAFRCF